LNDQERRKMLEEKYGKQFLRNRRKRQNRTDRMWASDLRITPYQYRYMRAAIRAQGIYIPKMGLAD
jgi:hypothetical protein